MRLVTAPRPGRIAVSITTAIMTVALGAVPAAASATWMVTPGGPFTGHASTTRLKDTTDGTSLNCTGSVLSGRFKPGSGLNGANIGSITGGGKFTGCTGCAGLINRGDSAAYLASYTLSPGQTITGP